MKNKFFALWILLVVVVFVTSSVPSSLSASPNAPQTSECSCVNYVTNRLFGTGRTVDYPSQNAEDMADQGYWNKAYDTYSQVGVKKRVNQPTAQFGDVIIMKHNAVVHSWDPKQDKVIQDNMLEGTDGSVSGHVGLVLWAWYRDDLGGWIILMRSAAWHAGFAVSSGADGSCPNVTDSLIFIPNGPAVTFWRETALATPTPTPTLPPPPVPLPPPTPCVPGPEMFAPPNGYTTYAKNTIFRWRGYTLNNGEYFELYVKAEGDLWRNPGGVIKQHPGEFYLEYNDFNSWNRGKYYWEVRAKRSDGSYATCEPNPPPSFTLIEKDTTPVPPSAPSSSSSSWSSWSTGSY